MKDFLDPISPKNRPLYDVLVKMSRSELVYLHNSVLKRQQKHIENNEKLRRTIMVELARAGKNSLNHWSEPPSYVELIRMVAKRLKLPAPSDSDIAEVERAILFKVIEKSVARMSADEKRKMVHSIEQELRAKGIDRKIAVDEVKDFVKLMVVDVGGTVGGVALAAPGVAGVVGLNFLQWVVLKAIIVSSGHIAAGGALLGFGVGGTLMGIAGAVGPIGAGLALLYTANVLAGPAFRYLIPAVCFVAAKRIELNTSVAGETGVN